MLLKPIPSYYLKQTTILCPFEQIGRVMRTVFSDNASHVQLLDGLRIDFHDSWVIIIPDGQKPFIHIYAEGQTEKEANSLLQKYASLIRCMIPKRPSLEPDLSESLHNQGLKRV